MSDKRWTRVIGDGIAYSGPCLLHTVIFWPDAGQDYADVYDGRDAVAGRKFCRMEVKVATTLFLDLEGGVPFDIGIYIDGIDSAVETTVIFTPL